jgi:hypothetical protein
MSKTEIIILSNLNRDVDYNYLKKNYYLPQKKYPQFMLA